VSNPAAYILHCSGIEFVTFYAGTALIKRSMDTKQYASTNYCDSGLPSIHHQGIILPVNSNGKHPNSKQRWQFPYDWWVEPTSTATLTRGLQERNVAALRFAHGKFTGSNNFQIVRYPQWKFSQVAKPLLLRLGGWSARAAPCYSMKWSCQAFSIHWTTRSLKRYGIFVVLYICSCSV